MDVLTCGSGKGREEAGVGATTGAVWGRVEQQDFRSRVRGTLLGAAVGDALGAPVDQLTLSQIGEAYGPEWLTDLASAYGRRGAITDLTQLTLFTVDGLIRAQVRRDTGVWHPPTDLHRAYLRWAATQRDWGPDERRKDDGWLAREEWLYARRDPSLICLLGFSDGTMGTLDAPKNPGASGAEAAARSAPFGLLVGWEPQLVFQLAVECAAQTHGAPTAYLAMRLLRRHRPRPRAGRGPRRRRPEDPGPAGRTPRPPARLRGPATGRHRRTPGPAVPGRRRADRR